MSPVLSFHGRITYHPRVIATKLMHHLIGIGLYQGCSGIALSQTAVGNSFRLNAQLYQHILDIISILFKVMFPGSQGFSRWLASHHSDDINAVVLIFSW